MNVAPSSGGRPKSIIKVCEQKAVHNNLSLLLSLSFSKMHQANTPNKQTTAWPIHSDPHIPPSKLNDKNEKDGNRHKRGKERSVALEQRKNNWPEDSPRAMSKEENCALKFLNPMNDKK